MSGTQNVEEHYLRVRQTSHLRLVLDAPCDADKLLAAGYAAQGSERKSLALATYGVLASEGMQGAQAVAESMSGWLVRRSIRAATRDRRERAITRVQAVDLTLKLLKLRHKPTCPSCQGRGHPQIKNTPVLDESRDCADCRGTGQIPISKVFQHEHIERMRWLDGEINSLCSMVFTDMARRLSSRMDL